MLVMPVYNIIDMHDLVIIQHYVVLLLMLFSVLRSFVVLARCALVINRYTSSTITLLQNKLCFCIIILMSSMYATSASAFRNITRPALQSHMLCS